MKIKSGLLLAVVLAASSAGSIAQGTNAVTTATASKQSGEVMPLIVIDDAPLSDAIRNLARQAGINLLFDPKAAAAMTNTVSFRLENITAENAMEALLDNNGFQIVMDPKTRISRVTTKDPAALEPLITEVVTLKYSHSTNMIPIVTAAFTTPRSKVLSDAKNNQLVILATAGEMQQITNTIAQLDISPQQILIEARFIETFENPHTQKGLNWAGTLQDRPFAFHTGGGNILATTSDGFGPVAFLNTPALEATLNFFNTSGQTETLSTPRAVALDGQPTELAVVRNYPVLEQEQGASNANGQQPTAVKVLYEITVGGTIINEIGTKLIVTPRIYAGSNVFLDLKPEISALEAFPATQTFDGEEFTAPIFNRRRIATQAMVPSGTTLVLGGLVSDAHFKNKTKVPILGDVPGLGRAFRSDSKEREKQHLLIFVTPTILDTGDYLPSPENREFLHQKPVDKPDQPWASWDNTEPKDWTKSTD